MPQMNPLLSIPLAVRDALWDLLYFLTGEGTWALRAHERIVLEAAITSLPHDAQQHFDALLKQRVFVQRSNRLVGRPRFYTKPYLRNHTSVDEPTLSHQLLNVHVDVDGERQVAHVEFFHGRIDSIQFKKPASFYAGKTVCAADVSLGNPNLSHASAIDRKEHGKTNASGI